MYSPKHRRQTSTRCLTWIVSIALLAMLAFPNLGSLVPSTLGYASEPDGVTQPDGGATDTNAGTGEGAGSGTDQGTGGTDNSGTEPGTSDGSDTSGGGGNGSGDNGAGDGTGNDDGTDGAGGSTGTGDQGNTPGDGTGTEPGEGENGGTTTEPGTPDAPKPSLDATDPALEQTDGMEVLSADGVDSLTAEQAEERGWVWTDYGNTVMITGCYGFYEWGHTGFPPGVSTGSLGAPLHIPSMIDDKPVTAIGNGAFYYYYSDDHNAPRSPFPFVSVLIPSSVSYIGYEAFLDQDSLQEVYFSEGLLSIGDSAFSSTSITFISLPSSVNNIGAYAFADMPYLSSADIPNRTIVLGQYVFSNTPSLESISIPGNIQVVPEGAFKDSGLTSLVLGEGVQEIGISAFENTNITELKCPTTLKTIGGYAFRNTKLVEVDCSTSLEQIAGYAFADCIDLRVAHIPASVTRITVNHNSEGTDVDAFLNVPRDRMVGYADAGSVAVKYLHDEGFDYVATAHSENDLVRAVYRKGVFLYNLEVSETGIDPDKLLSLLAQPEFAGFALASSHAVTFTIGGNPAVPSGKTFQLSIKYDKALKGENFFVYAFVPMPGDDSGSLIPMFVPSQEADGYVTFSYEEGRVWTGEYVLVYPEKIVPKDREKTEEEKALEERRSHGHIALTDGTSGGGGAAVGEGDYQYSSGAASTVVSKTGTSGTNTKTKVDPAQTIVDEGIPQAAVEGIFGSQRVPIPGTVLVFAGVTFPSIVIVFLILAIIVLGIILFYERRALRMKRIEKGL